jgi:hypothetical protein
MAKSSKSKSAVSHRHTYIFAGVLTFMIVLAGVIGYKIQQSNSIDSAEAGWSTVKRHNGITLLGCKAAPTNYRARVVNGTKNDMRVSPFGTVYANSSSSSVTFGANQKGAVTSNKPPFQATLSRSNLKQTCS